MSDFITKLSELIDPEVMGDMVSARIPKKLRVAPFAKIDDTLQGVPGDTITVPAYTYIGDASDVAEGGEVAIEKMTTSTRKATIKKAMKGIGLTDEAVLSGYGNPVGEANTQLAQAIAAKVDNDCMDALQTASLIYDGSQAQISYNAIVDAVDLFEEEMGCSDKVLFIHPKQVTQLRKNPDFLSADKYTPGVSLTGEIGMIAGCRLVPHAAALACMLLSQHDDAGCRADNAHTEQHPRYQHAGLPGVAVAQQALEDHQYQHAEQAHAEYCEHLVGGILFLRNWLFTHIVFCQCLTLPLFLLTCCRRHRARPQAPQSAQSHTAGCVYRAKRSAVPRPRLPLLQPDRSRPPARPSAKPCP